MTDRARAALLASAPLNPGAEFSTGGLRYIICDHERPDIDALFQAEKGKRIYPSPWLAAFREWEAENPVSDGNLRRVCEALTAEGFLTRRMKVQGMYSWAFYRLASAPAQEGTHE
ncbi:hypothetical protein [Deinococcus sp. Leaf326]|uniref:hypothetical protein n=1 Tax=Deinococcus sp. Leaf326 TaxID=1736338 RepID=UPI0006F80CF7|nr:hypothetical protein [Deinococcus sp. Leaf326]